MANPVIRNVGEDEVLDNIMSDNTTNQATPQSNGDAAADQEDAEALANATNEVARQKQKYLTMVGGIGREHGGGKKAMVLLAETMVEGASGGFITTDDAERFYQKFRKESDRKATLPDANAPVPAASSNEDSYKAQLSKVKAFIKFGSEYRDEGLETIQRARNIHLGMLANETDKALLKYASTYAALYSFAVEQRDEKYRGVPMSDAEMREHFMGEEAKPKDGFAYIEAAIKSAQQAKKGNAKAERKPIEHASIDDAISALRRVLGELAPDRLTKLDAKTKKAEVNAFVASFKKMLEDDPSIKLIAAPTA